MSLASCNRTYINLPVSGTIILRALSMGYLPVSGAIILRALSTGYLPVSHTIIPSTVSTLHCNLPVIGSIILSTVRTVHVKNTNFVGYLPVRVAIIWAL